MSLIIPSDPWNSPFFGSGLHPFNVTLAPLQIRTLFGVLSESKCDWLDTCFPFFSVFDLILATGFPCMLRFFNLQLFTMSRGSLFAKTYVASSCIVFLCVSVNVLWLMSNSSSLCTCFSVSRLLSSSQRTA